MYLSHAADCEASVSHLADSEATVNRAAEAATELWL